MNATIDAMTFSHKVLAACEDREWNASDLARRVGVSKNTTGRWLSGQSKPFEDSLTRLARVLNLSLDYLLDDAVEAVPTASLPDDERTVLAVYRALRLDSDQAIRALTLAAHAPPAEPGELERVTIPTADPSRKKLG